MSDKSAGKKGEGNTKWQELQERFHRQLAVLRSKEVPVTRRIKRGQSLEHLYQEFQALDKEHRLSANKAIKEWCASGMRNWPSLSEGVLTLLRVRLQTAEQLIHLVLLEKGTRRKQVVQAQMASLTEMAECILIKWWNTQGRQIGCEIWVAEQWETHHR
jgi:hypothetical protein